MLTYRHSIKVLHIIHTRKMATLPSPPFVNIPGIANFRDVGGQVDNVRKGLVYRSADPSKATQEGLEKMYELGM